MAKSDLIADARSKGIPLTGDETVAELEALLVAHGETQSAADAEEALASVPPEPTEQEVKVSEAKSKLDEAKTKLAEAEAEFKAAAEEHATAMKPVAVYGKHILLETGVHDQYSLADAPPNWENEKPRALLINGVNYEHTSTVDDSGVWIYRRM